MSLLEIHHLSKTFSVEGGVFRRRIGSVQALKDVSFTLEQGETLAVVGGSGCGKSTLAKLITGLLKPDTGDILWEGKPLDTFSRLERAHRVQMIFQDPFASLNPKLSVGTQLNEVIKTSPRQSVSRGLSIKRSSVDPGLQSAGKTTLTAKGDIIELLAAVGLPADTLDHYPFQFSGGQRQRIAIARALALQPSLLIADEPLSALDVTVQAQVLALLRELKASLGLTILFITHDLAVAESFSQRIIVLQEGEIVEQGATADVLSNPKHPYTQALRDAVPRIPCSI